MGAVSASNVSNTTVKKTLSISNSKDVPMVNSTSKIINGSGCCSVLLHVKDGSDVFAFRRDSTYSANLYFQRSNWYGKDTVKEYKMANGYFFHTIISNGGWIVATGGPDIPSLNTELENLAGRTSVSGYITQSTINSAYNILRSEGMGHFIIKAPNNEVGLVIYNGGSVKEALFKMGNGQYVSVPNGPGYYRSGYTSVSDPVYSAIHLETTDGWGLNRRNIMTYLVSNVNYSTQVKIWASTCRSTPDNIIFGGKTISKYSLPKIPNKLYIGQVTLKNPQVTLVSPNNKQTGVNRTAFTIIKFNEPIKPSTYFTSITIKNLITGKTAKISKFIKGNILYIQTTKKTAYTWYTVTIPQAAIKDNTGNNLLATYTFRFKTGTKINYSSFFLFVLISNVKNHSFSTKIMII